MTPIDLLASLPAESDLEPLVLVYHGKHYGALMDDTGFVVWRAAVPRRTESTAAQDAIRTLDDFQRR